MQPLKEDTFYVTFLVCGIYKYVKLLHMEIGQV